MKMLLANSATLNRTSVRVAVENSSRHRRWMGVSRATPGVEDHPALILRMIALLSESSSWIVDADQAVFKLAAP